MKGMKYKDIADKYSVTLSTVKSWKQRYEWDRKGMRTKHKKVCVQKKVADAPIDDGVKETLQNDELTDKQQTFCILYSRTFNATQSYQKAYGCTFERAMVSGCQLLRNPKIKAEIQRLKEIKAQQIVACEDDLVELQMRIAFSDVSNYMSFGRKTIDIDGVDVEVNEVNLRKSDDTDMQLIRKVKQGRDGVSIELEDKQKAIDWLTKHFLMHPDDKYRAEFDKKRAEVSDNSGEEILKNMKAIADILQNPVSNRKIEDYE
jgi:phage terminase small subunit